MLASLLAPSDPETTFLITGNFRGYLSPCGCTKPMSGGIRRLATVVRDLRQESTVLLCSANSVVEAGRQSELKVDAVLDVMKELRADAMALGSGDAVLGTAYWRGAQTRTGLLIQSEIDEASLANPSAEAAGWQILALGDRAGSLRTRLGAGPGLALDSHPRQVVLFEGSLEAAKARNEDVKAALVVYETDGSTPPATVIQDGTAYVSPGSQGRSVLVVRMRGNRYLSATAVSLGPDVADDAAVTQVFQRYLKRVTTEGLLDAIPRSGSAGYVGNRTCQSCHSPAKSVWQHSKHAQALKTLEAVNQDRDPDCVGCHVVGLTAKDGFQSRKKTPNMTDVGCESCHGAGKAHVKSPKRSPMPKVGSKSCANCHTPPHSPNFEFEAYWKRIKH